METIKTEKEIKNDDIEMTIISWENARIHLFNSRMLFPSRLGFSGVAHARVACDGGGSMLLFCWVLARDITESRDGDVRAELWKE
jgi:hypothetical protein